MLTSIKRLQTAIEHGVTECYETAVTDSLFQSQERNAPSRPPYCVGWLA